MFIFIFILEDQKSTSCTNDWTDEDLFDLSGLEALEREIAGTNIITMENIDYYVDIDDSKSVDTGDEIGSKGNEGVVNDDGIVLMDDIPTMSQHMMEDLIYDTGIPSVHTNDNVNGNVNRNNSIQKMMIQKEHGKLIPTQKVSFEMLKQLIALDHTYYEPTELLKEFYMKKVCLICGLRFLSKNILNKHRVIVHNMMPFYKAGCLMKEKKQLIIDNVTEEVNREIDEEAALFCTESDINRLKNPVLIEDRKKSSEGDSTMKTKAKWNIVQEGHIGGEPQHIESVCVSEKSRREYHRRRRQGNISTQQNAGKYWDEQEELMNKKFVFLDADTTPPNAEPFSYEALTIRDGRISKREHVGTNSDVGKAPAPYYQNCVSSLEESQRIRECITMYHSQKMKNASRICYSSVRSPATEAAREQTHASSGKSESDPSTIGIDSLLEHQSQRVSITDGTLLEIDDDNLRSVRKRVNNPCVLKAIPKDMDNNQLFEDGSASYPVSSPSVSIDHDYCSTKFITARRGRPQNSVSQSDAMVRVGQRAFRALVCESLPHYVKRTRMINSTSMPRVEHQTVGLPTSVTHPRWPTSQTMMAMPIPIHFTKVRKYFYKQHENSSNSMVTSQDETVRTHTPRVSNNISSFKPILPSPYINRHNSRCASPHITSSARPSSGTFVSRVIQTTCASSHVPSHKESFRMTVPLVRHTTNITSPALRLPSVEGSSLSRLPMVVGNVNRSGISQFTGRPMVSSSRNRSVHSPTSLVRNIALRPPQWTSLMKIGASGSIVASQGETIGKIWVEAPETMPPQLVGSIVKNATNNQFTCDETSAEKIDSATIIMS